MLKQSIPKPTNPNYAAILADIRDNAKKSTAANRNLPLKNLSNHQLSDTQLAEIDAKLHSAAASDRTRVLAATSKTHNILKQSLADAVMGWECNWDIDLSLTVPRNNPAYRCPVHLSKLLHGYFAAVDAVVFAGIPRRIRPKLNRFVVNEHADGIGWHCHAIIASPPNNNILLINNVLQSQWFIRIGLCNNPQFNHDRFYYSSIHANDFIAYTLKHAIDVNNCNLDTSRGIIDLHNTTFNI